MDLTSSTIKLRRTYRFPIQLPQATKMCLGHPPQKILGETFLEILGQIPGFWPSRRQRLSLPRSKTSVLKLINSETTGSFFSHGLENNTNSDSPYWAPDLRHRTGHYVSNQGYISVDTPPHGARRGAIRTLPRTIHRTGFTYCWSPLA
jgi:hypothetical protein